MRFVGKFALIAYGPVLLVSERGASLTEAALVVSCASSVAALASPIAARGLRYAPASTLLTASVALIGAGLIGLAALPSWGLPLAAAAVFGVGDGSLAVLQNGLVTAAAPPAVRSGVVAVSGMTRNAGKRASPLGMGLLVLAFSVPLAFATAGAIMWTPIPALRSVRVLDPLLSHEGRGEAAGRAPAEV
jgi:hypothetical protein